MVLGALTLNAGDPAAVRCSPWTNRLVQCHKSPVSNTPFEFNFQHLSCRRWFPWRMLYPFLGFFACRSHTAAISASLAESRVLAAGMRQGHVASALGSSRHTSLLLPLCIGLFQNLLRSSQDDPRSEVQTLTNHSALRKSCKQESKQLSWHLHFHLFSMHSKCSQVY